MRVLFITGEFPPMQGGVGDYTREIALALKDLDCQAQVVTSVQAGPVSGLVVHATIKRWDWGCWSRILELVHQQQPDVIHIQYQAAAYAMHPAINLLPWRLRRLGSGRPRIVVTFHDLKVPYLFPKAGRLRQWVVGELARRSDAAIATNLEDLENLSRELPTQSALIPIGSNISPQLPIGYDRDAWRARWGVGPDNLLLCFFGFINARKGVDTLLHALHHLASQAHGPLTDGLAPIVEPVLLMIGGRTGTSDPTNVAYLAHIRALVSELGLDSRVHWTGYIPAEEVSASFLAADLCVLPFRDGASFLHGTFHAALAHGVPIVTTQPRVDLPELAQGENVLLVAPEDPRALAEAIVRLASEPKLRETLARGAKALSAQFQWDKIAADTLDLYRTLVSTK